MFGPRLQRLRSQLAELCLCALLAFVVSGVSAPAAMSASLGANPALSELTKPETTATQTTATAATTEASDTKSSTVVIIVLGAAIALLVGIGYVIFRDARKVAPAGDLQLGEGSTPRHSPERLRRRRAKAKAARQQRKRNR